jgi:hypothetical protein
MKIRQLLTSQRVLQSACVLALVALGLFVWSLFDPRPIPVILAMSVGQVIGTVSLLAFLVVVARDLRAGQRREPVGAEKRPF